MVMQIKKNKCMSTVVAIFSIDRAESAHLFTNSQFTLTKHQCWLPSGDRLNQLKATLCSVDLHGFTT